MVMTEFYEGEKEKSRHDSAVKSLADELGLPIKEIGAVYEGAFEELRKGARIKDYLMILATRKVKDLLYRRRKRAA